MNQPLLTIMIPTHNKRKIMFHTLYRELIGQVLNHQLLGVVEIIFFQNSGEYTSGKLRQTLLEEAKGKYVVGIDDDDWVASDYVISIVTALRDNPDVDHVGFIEEASTNGIGNKKAIFSIKYSKWASDVDGWDYIRCANPKSVIKKSIAAVVGFNDQHYTEDIAFSQAVTPLLKTEVFINRVLYYYRFTTDNRVF